MYDNLEKEAKSILNVNILTAKQLSKHFWNPVLLETIYNCWKHCFQTDRTNCSVLESVKREIDDTVASLDRNENKQFPHVGTDSLLKSREENNPIENFNISSSAPKVAFERKYKIKKTSLKVPKVNRRLK